MAAPSATSTFIAVAAVIAAICPGEAANCLRTELTAIANKGSQTLAVASEVGFAKGEFVTIGEQTVELTNLSPLTLSVGLDTQHPVRTSVSTPCPAPLPASTRGVSTHARSLQSAGYCSPTTITVEAKAGDDTIEVAAPANIGDGATIFVGDEAHTVASIGPIVLKEPLKVVMGIETQVRCRCIYTNLQADVAAGAMEIKVEDPAGVKMGDLVMIDYEKAVVERVDGTTLYMKHPVENSHGKGVTVGCRIGYPGRCSTLASCSVGYTLNPDATNEECEDDVCRADDDNDVCCRELTEDDLQAAQQALEAAAAAKEFQICQAVQGDHWDCVAVPQCRWAGRATMGCCTCNACHETRTKDGGRDCVPPQGSYVLANGATRASGLFSMVSMLLAAIVWAAAV